MCKLLFSLLLVVSALAAGATEPFIGTLRNTKGKPVKGVKVYLHNPKDAVKSDKNGEFKLEDLASGDTIHISYKNMIHSFAVDNRQDIMFVVGEDNRIFEIGNYVGETFHGHLFDYKGKPIRGAVVYTSDPFDYVKSDRDGNFLLDNVVDTDTVHIKHDGYIHDIAMDGSKGMYIKIQRSHGRRIDDDIIDTGVGYMRLRDYNGPYSKMTSKQLEACGTSNIAQALNWMPGVTVSPDGKIWIRGGWCSPLWVVDGVATNPVDLTVMEVKSIVVLKDGAMYGSRGAGGVIIVTTKGSDF